MGSLWVEKWRPRTLAEFVWPSDPAVRERVTDWWQRREIPNLLFHGPPGTGKTSLAKILAERVAGESVLFLNASLESGIDTIRGKIREFTVRGGTVDTARVVILDEADYLSPTAQAALRGLLEENPAWVRFVFSVNEVGRIIRPLRSRLQEFDFSEPDLGQFVERLFFILGEERVEVDTDVLEKIVERCWPDLRRTVNAVEKYTRDGKITDVDEDRPDESDVFASVLKYVRDMGIAPAVSLCAGQVSEERHPALYRYLAEHVEEFGGDEPKRLKILVALRNGMVEHDRCIDRTLNLVGTLAAVRLVLVPETAKKGTKARK